MDIQVVPSHPIHNTTTEIYRCIVEERKERILLVPYKKRQIFFSFTSFTTNEGGITAQDIAGNEEILIQDHQLTCFGGLAIASICTGNHRIVSLLHWITAVDSLGMGDTATYHCFWIYDTHVHIVYIIYIICWIGIQLARRYIVVVMVTLNIKE